MLTFVIVGVAYIAIAVYDVESPVEVDNPIYMMVGILVGIIGIAMLVLSPDAVLKIFGIVLLIIGIVLIIISLGYITVG